MRDLTDQHGNNGRLVGRKKLKLGESPGRWDEETGEYRKFDGDIYYFSFSGLIYYPLTPEQVQMRGVDTFSE